jgi:hypothetical protein
VVASAGPDSRRLLPGAADRVGGLDPRHPGRGGGDVAGRRAGAAAGLGPAATRQCLDPVGLLPRRLRRLPRRDPQRHPRARPGGLLQPLSREAGRGCRLRRPLGLAGKAAGAGCGPHCGDPLSGPEPAAARGVRRAQAGPGAEPAHGE